MIQEEEEGERTMTNVNCPGPEKGYVVVKIEEGGQGGGDGRTRRKIIY